MSYKTIQLYCPRGNFDDLEKIAESSEVIELHHAEQKDETILFTILVLADHVQTVTDKIQQVLGNNPKYRTLVITVDAVIPKPEQEQNETEENTKEKKQFLGVSREELLEIVSKGVVIDANFFFLVVLSTIVAAIGLLEDNVAVVIGAMVIAPLLGPNLALAFATALGDIQMMKQAIKANLSGFSTCLVIAAGIGFLWPYTHDSKEMLMRADVSFDGVILAIVSGAAAVLSLTRGISSVMVGVMVAVALLPPATTFGIMLGAGEFSHAYGALLLLAVNIVCINLSAKLTLLLKGVRPRTWYEQKTANYTVRWYPLFWVLALIVLLIIIYLKSGGLRLY